MERRTAELGEGDVGTVRLPRVLIVAGGVIALGLLGNLIVTFLSHGPGGALRWLIPPGIALVVAMVLALIDAAAPKDHPPGRFDVSVLIAIAAVLVGVGVGGFALTAGTQYVAGYLTGNESGADRLVKPVAKTGSGITVTVENVTYTSHFTRIEVLVANGGKQAFRIPIDGTTFTAVVGGLMTLKIDGDPGVLLNEQVPKLLKLCDLLGKRYVVGLTPITIGLGETFARFLPHEARHEKAADVDRLTTVIEDFNTIFIRLPSVQRLNFSALSVLHTLDRNGPLRLTALLATEQLKQPALTSLVGKLEQDGLLQRRPDPADGRASLLSLTRTGRWLVRSRHANRVAKLTTLVDQLTPGERVVLAGSIDVLHRLTELATETA